MKDKTETGGAAPQGTTANGGGTPEGAPARKTMNADTVAGLLKSEFATAAEPGAGGGGEEVPPRGTAGVTESREDGAEAGTAKAKETAEHAEAKKGAEGNEG